MFGLPNPFKRPTPHKEVKYVTATRAESNLALRKRIAVQLELAVACSQLTDDERTAARVRGATR